MRNIAYRRVSTTQNGQSTDRQLFELNVVFDLEFEDYSSGTNMSNRPQLQSCVETLEEGDCLWIHSIDRLARNTGELLTLIQKLKDRGVSVKFVKEGLFIGNEGDSTSKAMAGMLLSVLGGVHTFQATMIQESVKDGMKLAKAKGKLIGGANPIWHKTFQKNRALGKHKRSAQVASTREKALPAVEYVKNALTLTKGNLTQEQLANYLNDKGFTTSRGKPYSKVAVSRLIKTHGIDYSAKSKHDNL